MTLVMHMDIRTCHSGKGETVTLASKPSDSAPIPEKTKTPIKNH